jgi:hypothetical protein
MSYALQPHRSVASKNGDLRYHGPKYNVVETASEAASVFALNSRHPFLHRIHASLGRR